MVLSDRVGSTAPVCFFRLVGHFPQCESKLGWLDPLLDTQPSFSVAFSVHTFFFSHGTFAPPFFFQTIDKFHRMPLTSSSLPPFSSTQAGFLGFFFLRVWRFFAAFSRPHHPIVFGFLSSRSLLGPPVVPNFPGLVVS